MIFFFGNISDFVLLTYTLLQAQFYNKYMQKRLIAYDKIFLYGKCYRFLFHINFFNLIKNKNENNLYYKIILKSEFLDIRTEKINIKLLNLAKNF